MGRRWRWRQLIGIPVISVVVAAGTFGAIGLFKGASVRTGPHIEAIEPPVIRPGWPSPRATTVDFSTWSSFGGIDATLLDEGRRVLLDTRDTIETSRTKWSGLIEPGPPRCLVGFKGRVRTASHRFGEPGGFAIGLAVIGPSDSLRGNGFQFDYGFRGYRLATYPGDGGFDVASSVLNDGWHVMEVTMGPTRQTLSVDGRVVLDVASPAPCGEVVLRVWAGAAEFSDFSFTQS